MITKSKQSENIRNDVMTSFSFSGVNFVFVLLRFSLYAFIEAAALRSIVFPYAGPSIATRFLFVCFFLFAYLEMSLFSETVFFLNGEYVVRFFLPDGVFCTL